MLFVTLESCLIGTMMQSAEALLESLNEFPWAASDPQITS